MNIQRFNSIIENARSMSAAELDAIEVFAKDITKNPQTLWDLKDQLVDFARHIVSEADIWELDKWDALALGSETLPGGMLGLLGLWAGLDEYDALYAGAN